MKRINFALLVAALATASSGSVHATPLYHLTNLSPFGFTTVPNGINDLGQVVGQSTSGHALIYTNGVITDIGKLGTQPISAMSINASGQVVGQGTSIPGIGFEYSGGTLVNLETATNGKLGPALAINNSGQFVCVGANNSGYIYSGGIATNLGNLGGNQTLGWTTSPNAINSSGEVVGNSYIPDGNGATYYHAFAWVGGHISDLGTLSTNPSDSVDSQALGINDNNQIVGASQLGGGTYPIRAFLYSNGTMTNLGSLFSTDLASYAEAINNSGQIVGYSEQANQGDLAFLDVNGSMIRLDSLLDSSGNGWTLLSARAINNNGWIVGQGNKGAYLLTPVPEPSCLILSALALAAFSARVVIKPGRRLRVWSEPH